MEWLTLGTAVIGLLSLILGMVRKRMTEKKNAQTALTKRSLSELDAGVDGMQPPDPRDVPPV